MESILKKFKIEFKVKMRKILTIDPESDVDFDAMNFQHFFGNVGNYVIEFPKNARNSLHQKC